MYVGIIHVLLHRLGYRIGNHRQLPFMGIAWVIGMCIRSIVLDGYTSGCGRVIAGSFGNAPCMIAILTGRPFDNDFIASHKRNCFFAFRGLRVDL